MIKVTLNRPVRLNAINATMHREMRDVFERARLDRSARCLVIAGAGRGFRAWADRERRRSGAKGRKTPRPRPTPRAAA